MSGRRAVILIDGGYLRGDRDTPEDELVEVQGLLPAIVDRVKGIGSIAVRYYDCLPYLPENPTDIERFRYTEQDKLLTALRLAGVTVTLGQMIKPPGEPPRQKGVDVQIAIDLLDIAYRRFYDLAIVVSNDGDFHPAIRKAIDLALTVGVVFLDFGARAKVNYRLGKSARFEIKLRRKCLQERIDLKEAFHPDFCKLRREKLRRDAGASPDGPKV